MSAGLLDQARRQWAVYLSELWHSGGWDQQSDDERDYSQRHLAAHLDEAGVPDRELHALIDERWLRAWWAHEGTYEGFLADVERAWLRAELAGDLVAQIKCALCAASGATLSANASPELLAAAVEHGVLGPEQALGIVRREREPGRAPRLIALAPHLPARSIDQALDIAEGLALVYAHIQNRSDVLAALAPRIPPLLQARALELAGSISDDASRANAIAALAPHVADEQVGALLALARGVDDGPARAKALCALLPRLPEVDNRSAAIEAFVGARSAADLEVRADTLTSLLGHVRGPLRSRVWRAALAASRQIGRSRIDSVDAREDATLKAEKIGALLPHAARPAQQAAIAREALSAIAHVHSSNRSFLLRMVMPHLPAVARPHAVRVVLASGDHDLSDVLEAIAAHMTPRQMRVAVRRAATVRLRKDRAEALLALAKFAEGTLRGRLVQAIVALAPRLEDGQCLDSLAAVAPIVPSASRERLLEIASRIRDATCRARAITRLLPLLPADLAPLAVSRAWAATNRRMRREDQLDILTEVLPFASGRVRARLERSRPALVRAVGSGRLSSDRIFSHARMLVQLGRIDDAFAAITAIRYGRERTEAFTSLVGVLPAEHRIRAVRAALASARESDDEEAMAKWTTAATPEVDLVDLSCTEQMIARAGFYATNDDEGTDDDLETDEDEDEDEGEDDSEYQNDEEYDRAGGGRREVDLDAEIERIKAIADERDRARALKTLARLVPQSAMGALLDAALLVRSEDSRREVMERMAARLARQHWPQAFDVADSIRDADEHAEALIVIAQHAPEPYRRAAQERALDAIPAAVNEDDSHEPLLRLALAENFPVDLFPRVLQVAAELQEHQTADRRARVFTGLAQDFARWVKRDPEAAQAGWSDALRRMARRPRPELLHDLAGFHHLGRLLVRRNQEARYVASLRDTVARVCAWR